MSGPRLPLPLPLPLRAAPVAAACGGVPELIENAKFAGFTPAEAAEVAFSANRGGGALHGASASDASSRRKPGDRAGPPRSSCRGLDETSAATRKPPKRLSRCGRGTPRPHPLPW